MNSITKEILMELKPYYELQHKLYQEGASLDEERNELQMKLAEVNNELECYTEQLSMIDLDKKIVEKLEEMVNSLKQEKSVYSIKNNPEYSIEELGEKIEELTIELSFRKENIDEFNKGYLEIKKEKEELDLKQDKLLQKIEQINKEYENAKCTFNDKVAILKLNKEEVIFSITKLGE